MCLAQSARCTMDRSGLCSGSHMSRSMLIVGHRTAISFASQVLQWGSAILRSTQHEVSEPGAGDDMQSLAALATSPRFGHCTTCDSIAGKLRPWLAGTRYGIVRIRSPEPFFGVPEPP